MRREGSSALAMQLFFDRDRRWTPRPTGRRRTPRRFYRPFQKEKKVADVAQVAVEDRDLPEEAEHRLLELLHGAHEGGILAHGEGAARHQSDDHHQGNAEREGLAGGTGAFDAGLSVCQSEAFVAQLAVESAPGGEKV